MKTMQLKSSVIELTEQTQSQPVSTAVLAYFKIVIDTKNRLGWDQLSEAQQQEVIDAFLDSEDDNTLIPIEAALDKLK